MIYWKIRRLSMPLLKDGDIVVSEDHLKRLRALCQVVDHCDTLCILRASAPEGTSAVRCLGAVHLSLLANGLDHRLAAPKVKTTIFETEIYRYSRETVTALNVENFIEK
jgi:hypothetical protein